MNLKASLTLFAWSIVLTVIVLLLVAKPMQALAEYHDQLEKTLPANAAPAKVEPYGGCDEAHLYPDTPGYTWCKRNGLLG